MARYAASLAGLVTGVATTRPGAVLLEAAVLARFAVLLRGSALSAALDMVRYTRFLAGRGRFLQARAVLRKAARMMGERPETAVLSLEDCIIDLYRGEGDSRRAALAAQHVLDLADQAWDLEDDESVVGLISSVLRVMFHPRLHFGATGSALSADPKGFLAPLRASRAFREVTQPVAVSGSRQGPRATSAAQAGTTPHKVLFVSLRNWNFVRDIVADYENDSRFEVRSCDLADLPRVLTQEAVMAQRISLLRGRDLRPRLPERTVEDLAWADTIFVEWGSTAAYWASLMVPLLAPQARLLVRIHSYEALTPLPQLIDWSTVDGLVTVSPSIRNLLQASVDLPAGLEVTTLPNRALLTRFRLPKTSGADRTIAMVGWGSVVKDPAWALDVLELVRRQDPSWSLLLIGPGFSEDLAEPEARYAEEVRARISALGSAVKVTGRTSDVPGCLQQAGVILSCSRREGTHEGLIEGVSSGALPVVRNWPDVARWGGSAALFPHSWIVETPEAAAERILALSDDEAYRSRQADWMIAQADWGSVRPLYDALLLGQPVASAQRQEQQEGPWQ